MTRWIVRLEYVPFAGQEKVEEEEVCGTAAAALNYYQGLLHDPRFRKVSLIREITDRQVMREHLVGSSDAE